MSRSGQPEWSNWESDASPRISSMVATTSVVLTNRCDTPPRFQGRLWGALPFKSRLLASQLAAAACD